MAEPISFVASVIAVTTLAENVVTKGYRYLKAVKNCPDEVRKLMAESNVLCGALGRLKVLLEGNKSKIRVATKSKGVGSLGLDDTHDKNHEEGIVSSDDEVIAAFENELHPPDFIYQCQKTLHEIDDVLRKFKHTSPQSTQTAVSTLRFNGSSFRRMEAKDLKWPLRKSETMQLIEALERHKSTCTLALTEHGLAGIHTVLEKTKFSNKCLADLKAKQEKLFELSITREQEVALAWLLPVNPASKLQGFRRERQSGSGRWLFDLPEMSAWLETSNSALWIYGIPGAGKTILSTLVVDEVLTRKRSSSIGTAYFYIRHDDKHSQIPSNVLGSIISQLARQNSAALDDVVELHTERLRKGSLTTIPDDDDLIKLLFGISKYFMDTFIMIDGLDECGFAFDRDRKRLIDILSDIHRNEKCQIHTLIFSRDELDIRKRLTATGFQIVSIAATSADLRLFVNAWLPSLDIQSETLKVEVIDRLVDEANGMFMWVRAQVDYLQRLPNDMEKRIALKSLPPDLPQTYVRIFEMIDSTYPIQTTKFVQRLLKWLVLPSYVNELSSFHTLRQAICIENEHDTLSDTEMPTEEQLLGWLGCLVRRSKDRDFIELSHFTIKEFLRMDPENVSSTVARKYLVKPEEENYLLKVCLQYLMHDNFRSTTCSELSEAESLRENHPLYEYAAESLCAQTWAFIDIGMNNEVKCIMQRFLSFPVCKSFQLCGTFLKWLDYRDALTLSDGTRTTLNFISPLHFACRMALTDEVQRLLKLGIDADGSNLLTEEHVEILTPLHLTLVEDAVSFSYERDIAHLTIDFRSQRVTENGGFYPEHLLQIIKILLNAGADVDKQLALYIHCPRYYHHENLFGATVTPLVLAVLCGSWRAASILLDAGADCDAVLVEHSQNETEIQDDWLDLCSIGSLLKKFDDAPEVEESVRHFVAFGGHQSLETALKRWQDLRGTSGRDGQSTEGTSDSDGQSIEDTASGSSSLQQRFIDAYTNGKWLAVRKLLEAEAGIEINCNDEQGKNSLYYASDGNTDDLRFLIEKGANPNLLTAEGYSALCKAASRCCLENMSLLLECNADIEHREPGGWTPLLCAVSCSMHEMVKQLLHDGANADALLDDGGGAIHLAIEQRDIDMFSLLLEHGINTTSADNYASTPLHFACKAGLQDVVEKLIQLVPESNDGINDDSLINGTPLYGAARKGFVSVVQKLLDAGAAIDKTGPGNILGSALMVACSEGYCEIVKLLLSKGASTEVEGSRFLTAAGTARAFRQEPILKILEEHANAMHQAENE